MTAVYISTVNNAFAYALWCQATDETYEAHTLEEANAHLSYVGKVVLIGRQEPVFGDLNSYLSFIARAHAKGKKVLAVVERGTALPNNNHDIDTVIESIRGATTVTGIAHQIAQG